MWHAWHAFNSPSGAEEGQCCGVRRVPSGPDATCRQVAGCVRIAWCRGVGSAHPWGAEEFEKHTPWRFPPFGYHESSVLLKNAYRALGMYKPPSQRTDVNINKTALLTSRASSVARKRSTSVTQWWNGVWQMHREVAQGWEPAESEACAGSIQSQQEGAGWLGTQGTSAPWKCPLQRKVLRRGHSAGNKKHNVGLNLEIKSLWTCLLLSLKKVSPCTHLFLEHLGYCPAYFMYFTS